MRIFKDLKLVEQLGTGVQRILQHYGKESFMFTENFIRVTFPADEDVIKYLDKKATEQVTEQATEQVTEQVKKLILVMENAQSREELMQLLNLSHREYFRAEFLQKSIELELVELTIPDKPKSSKQKYRLTEKGKKLKEKLKNERI